MASSSATKIQNVLAYKENIRKAINAKGIKCDKGVPLSEYSNKINNIRSFTVNQNITAVPDEIFSHLFGSTMRNGQYLFYQSTLQKITPDLISWLWQHGSDYTTNCSYMFASDSSLTGFDADCVFNLPSAVNLSYMFSSCTNSAFSLSNAVFNLPEATNLSYMFNGCTGLKNFGGFTLNAPKATTATYMFYGCSGLTTLGTDYYINLPKCSAIDYMFYGCSSLKTFAGNFIVGNDSAAVTLSYTFHSCSNLESIDLSCISVPLRLSTCAFTNTYRLRSFNCNDISYATTYPFANCASLSPQACEDICSKLDCGNDSSYSSVTASYLFAGARILGDEDYYLFSKLSWHSSQNYMPVCGCEININIANTNSTGAVNLSYLFSPGYYAAGYSNSYYSTSSYSSHYYVYKITNASSGEVLWDIGSRFYNADSTIDSNTGISKTIYYGNNSFSSYYNTYLYLPSRNYPISTSYYSTNYGGPLRIIQNIHTYCDFLTKLNPTVISINCAEQVNLSSAFGARTYRSTTTGYNSSYVSYGLTLYDYSSNYSATVYPCYGSTTVSNLDLSKLPSLNIGSDETISSARVYYAYTDGDYFGCQYPLYIKKLYIPNCTNFSSCFGNRGLLFGIDEIEIGTSYTSLNSTFYNCSLLQKVPAFETSSVTDMNYTFWCCYYLKTIPALNMISVTSASNMLAYCFDVEHIYLYNIKTTLDISYCYKVPKGSGTGEDGGILDIFNNLSAVESKTLTLHGQKDSTTGEITLWNGDVLSAEEILIATNKGWTISCTNRIGQQFKPE